MLLCGDGQTTVVVAIAIVVCAVARITVVIAVTCTHTVTARGSVAGHQPCQPCPGQRQRDRIALDRVGDRPSNVTTMFTELIRKLAGNCLYREFILQIIQGVGQSGAFTFDLAFDFFGRAAIICHCKPPSRLARRALRF